MMALICFLFDWHFPKKDSVEDFAGIPKAECKHCGEAIIKTDSGWELL